MKILKAVQAVPGGLIVVPMFVAAAINTVFPQALRIGGPTSGAFATPGIMTVIGIILFVTGCRLELRNIMQTLRRGAVLCAARVLIGFAATWLVLRLFGSDGFLGISAIAVAAVMVSCNPGIYLALVTEYGDAADEAVYGLITVITVPATAIFVIGAAGGGGIDYMSIASTLIPFFLGVALGNLDPAIRKLMAPGIQIIQPFLGMCFGASVNLVAAATAGLSGILLTLLFVVINGSLMIAIDRVLLRRPGYAGMATCTVAGISVVVPSMLGASNPAYARYVPAATAQLALAMVITSFAVPWIVRTIVRWTGSGKAGPEVVVPGVAAEFLEPA
jgi:2-keto-3-deoxygluconate permease